MLSFHVLKMHLIYLFIYFENVFVLYRNKHKTNKNTGKKWAKIKLFEFIEYKILVKNKGFHTRMQNMVCIKLKLL